MSAIDDKWQQLKVQGLDLGGPLGPEEPAPAGGKVRRYERGHIYWSSATGAHEVHGGILSLYLAHGGPGNSPQTGDRLLGYPVTDELNVEGVPRSIFESGAIYWTPGTGGCVLWGSIWATYQRPQVGSAAAGLGLPLIGNTPLAGGQAAYFERGVLFSAGIVAVLAGRFDPPLMGRPQLIDPDDQGSRTLQIQVTWPLLMRSHYQALIDWRPSVFAELWTSRLVLSPVGSPFSHIPVVCQQVSLRNDVPHIQQVDVYAVMTIPPNGALDLKDRTLYDLQLKLPNGTTCMISPHCLYAKRDWDNFGLLHITDLHISQRNDQFRRKLQEHGLEDAAQNYANFQDNLRDFIRYANRLHAQGLADLVMATGDLVDYVAEANDGLPGENFARLRRILLGAGLNHGDAPGEALRIPIYMTFGNHDYRVNPYDLRADIDLPSDSKDTALNEHSSHNLLESDAIALQDGRTPKYGLSNIEGAGKMLQYDRFDNRYNYFKFHFTGERTYVVRLGKHRLVVMDTKMDNGIPDDFDIWTLINLGLGGSGFLSGQFGSGLPATQKLLAGGGPDSVGPTERELGLLRNAVVEAGTDGLVIVGMHCPVISPKGSEYAYFHRETIHPLADPGLTDAYLVRHKIEDGRSWTRTGTPYFKTGEIADGMDAGVIAHQGEEFLRICAGVGLPRPVDLVLAGHHHDRVEYRVRWNAAAGTMEYYMDFYTENPKTYYHSINGRDVLGVRPLPKGAVIAVRVEPDPAQPVVLSVSTNHRINLTHGTVRTPAYGDPLNSTSDPKAWWQKHRPLLAQTSALGPIDPRQRYGAFYRLQPPPQHYRPVIESDREPNVPQGVSVEKLPGRLVPPTFQGFRLVQVRAGAIARMRYIVLRELRKSNFTLSWEGEFADPRRPHRPIVNGGVIGRF